MCQIKKNIYRFQAENDHLIVKRYGEYSDQFAAEATSHIHFFDSNTLPADWKLSIPGKHNRENLGVVYEIAKILGIDENVVKKSVTLFKGVPYRLEKVADIRGTTFVNDTTATTPTAAVIALNSFEPGRIVWIGGGHSKKLPLTDLVNTVDERVKKFVLLEGEGTTELLPQLKSRDKMVGLYRDFRDAVTAALRAADPGDTVLLSPGFSSFGMFVNEFDRGDQFNKIVDSLR